jgi:D-lactate dehydrogenase
MRITQQAIEVCSLSTSALLQRLRPHFAPDALLDDPAQCHVYGYDSSKRHGQPALVALATETAQIQTCVRACADLGIALTTRGRGTATTGAAVPNHGGLVLSLERMDQILTIDSANRYARVQPGVLNGNLQHALAPHGFFWPPDPTSAPYCTVGGNLACNAGGPRTVKYGACRENVLGLSAVDGRGALFHTGQFTSKGAVGYDLTRTLVGSEGTLAIIVEATLKLVPLAAARLGARASFASVQAAAHAVARIMAQAVTPSALEFLDNAALNLLRQHSDAPIPPGAALLLIEVDGPVQTLGDALAAVAAAAQVDGLLEFAAARDGEDSARLWAARKALSPVLRQVAPKKINEDVVVPVGRLPELIDGVALIGQREGLTVVNFGHAGNGNIHVNFLLDPSDAVQAAAAARAVHALFDLVLKLGGTLSGEHGIGIDKRPFVSSAVDAHALSLMRGIKQVFDPANILNPGKVLPELSS